MKENVPLCVQACEGFPLQLTVAAEDDIPNELLRIYIEDKDIDYDGLYGNKPLYAADGGSKNPDFFRQDLAGRRASAHKNNPNMHARADAREEKEILSASRSLSFLQTLSLSLFHTLKYRNRRDIVCASVCVFLQCKHLCSDIQLVIRLVGPWQCVSTHAKM